MPMILPATARRLPRPRHFRSTRMDYRCRRAPQWVIRSSRTAMHRRSEPRRPIFWRLHSTTRRPSKWRADRWGAAAPRPPVSGLAASAARCAIQRSCRSFGARRPAAKTVHGYLRVGIHLDLTNPELATAVIRIGPESIDMKSLPASPRVVPTTLAVTQIVRAPLRLGQSLYLDRHGDRHHRDHGPRHLGQLRYLRREGRRLVECRQSGQAAGGPRHLRPRDQHLYRDLDRLRALN